MTWVRSRQTGIWHLVEQAPTRETKTVKPVCTIDRVQLLPGYETSVHMPDKLLVCVRCQAIDRDRRAARN